MIVPYTEDATYITFFDESGKSYTVDLEGLPVKVKDNKINIYYYKGQANKAKAQTEPIFWLTTYVIVSPAFAISVYRCFQYSITNGNLKKITKSKKTNEI